MAAEKELTPDQTGQVEVSVCMSAYNHEDFIERAIEKVMSQQTTFNFEVLVGEDLSTDRTPEICDQLAEKYAGQLRIIHRTKEEKLFINGKPVGRGNMLDTILQSKGRFVAMHDGDDFWTTPTKLQEQWDFIQKNPSVCLSFGNCYRLVEGKRTAIAKNHKASAPYILADFPKAMCDGLPAGCLPSSFFFSRSVFEKGLVEIKQHFMECPFFDLLIPFSMSRFGKIAYHPDPCFCYLVRQGSIKGGGENREMFAVRCHEWITHYLTTRECAVDDVEKLARRYSRKHSVVSQLNGFEKVIQQLKECEYLEFLPSSTYDKIKARVKQSLQSSSGLSSILIQSLPDFLLRSCFQIQKRVI